MKKYLFYHILSDGYLSASILVDEDTTEEEAFEEVVEHYGPDVLEGFFI